MNELFTFVTVKVTPPETLRFVKANYRYLYNSTSI